jgi:hypothetical protein
MKTESFITPKELPKEFDDLSLIILMNFWILNAKSNQAEIMSISKEDDGILLCPSRPSNERSSWLGCQKIRKKLSKEEFESIIEGLKTAGWKIEQKDNGYIFYFQ